MKAKDFILISVVILGFAFMYAMTKKESKAERDHAIDSLYRAHEVLIDFDSIEQRITKNIIDSMMIEIGKTNKALKTIQQHNDQTRKQNEELVKKFNSLVVTRPDF
jgi:hypothetical protein